MATERCCQTCAEWVQEYELPIGECDVRFGRTVMRVEGKGIPPRQRLPLATAARFGEDCPKWRKGRGRAR